MSKSPFKLRPYQQSTKDTFSKIAHSHPLLQIVAPTGSGKTAMYQACTETKPSDRFIMLMPRINLANQTLQYNKDWGLLQGKNIVRPNARVMLGTIKTILNRLKEGRITPTTFRYWFIDEMHLEALSKSETKSMKSLIKQVTEAGMTVIGMTATPYDGKGRPLEIWEGAIDLMPKEWLDINKFIEAGYLTPLRYKVVGSIKSSLLKMGKEDFTKGSMDDAVKDSAVDVIGMTLKHRLDATLILASSIDHANGLYEDLKLRGYSVGVLHSNSKDKDLLEQFEKGKIEFLVSVNMIVTGTDLPIARTIVLARPIGSQSLYRQAIGRVLRLYKDKPFSLVLDCYNSIELLESHPLQSPPPSTVKTERKVSLTCLKCESKKPLAVTDVVLNEDDGIQITQKKCVDCGDETEVEKMIDFVTCEKCMESQILKNVYSFDGWAVCNCGNCDNRIMLNKLEPKELILTFQNRAEAVSTIKIDASKRLTNGELVRFNKAFDIFSIYAELDYLSAIVDFLGNVRKEYTDASLYKIIDRMEERNKEFRGSKTDTLLIDLFLREKIEINYELIRWIDEVTRDKQEKKAIFTRIKSTWIKKDDISNTKKYKTNIKKFITWLKKQRGES